MNGVRVPRFGGPEVLELTALPDPSPAAGEVLLEIRAAGVNWSDLLMRAGTYPGGAAAAVRPRDRRLPASSSRTARASPRIRSARASPRITGTGFHASRAVVPPRAAFPCRRRCHSTTARRSSCR
jgi:NADPH:quinone reductase-like Zn-dependent oxidoreductase